MKFRKFAGAFAIASPFIALGASVFIYEGISGLIELLACFAIGALFAASIIWGIKELMA